MGKEYELFVKTKEFCDKCKYVLECIEYCEKAKKVRYGNG